MYKERMLGYYPSAVSDIVDYQAIIAAEAPEFENADDARTKVLNDAYLSTMDEDRIIQWEKALGITPLNGSTLQDRRDTITARLRGQGKLNTALISSIVNAFTGGTAKSWFKNSTIYVEITPPPGNKEYKFSNVENELKYKIPAHLGLSVDRNYFEWKNVKDNYATWDDVRTEKSTWEDVYLSISP